ncbi:acyl-CoA synthase [Actinomadura sp. KC216]|uniref:AMP-binding protein n=1 Tax=Actinomadura sp. KC216 TaxID=2530370 RepID=UPI00104B2627|nr:AMP-binding protein [Actinomadura sp. KC216]TDB90696.1 acyl-CoA synthase [Actinomadura sp. KC216]
MNAALELEQRARREPFLDRPAFYTGDRTWTHGEVHRRAACAAAGLAARGLTAGDRLVLLADDGIGLVATFLGAARLGAVTVLANPSLTAADHRYLVADSKARLLVTDLPGVDAGISSVHPDELVAASPGDGHAAADLGPDAPLYVQYTSGTTGRPKGAVHRHGDLLDYHRLVGGPVLGVGRDDVLLSVSKMYFAYGLGNSLAFPLASGCSAVLFRHRPSPAEVVEAVGRRGVTLLFSVPSFYARLPDTLPDGPDERLRSLRAAVTAGEAVSRELLDATSALLGVPLWDQIGATEAGHAFCSNGVTGNAPGTLGRAVPGFDLEVRGSDGSVSADGEVGELWVRGPTVMPGYLDAPEATARVLVDGWLNTRDRARRRPDGTLEYHGRTDDIEVVGGINVHPAEIERVLRRHPDVREAAVVAVGDATGATSLHAFVVPARDVSRDVLQDELRALAKERLAPFKVPRWVRLCEALPRTPSGKLQRFKLRDESHR